MGTMIGYGSLSDLQHASLWQSVAGTFSLVAAGDTVIIYCRKEDDSIHHLSALSFSGNWAAVALAEDDCGTDSSALPESLVLARATTTLSHFDNYRYDGSTSGTRSSLLGAIIQEGLWTGSNNERYSTPESRGSFEIKSTSLTSRTKPTCLPLGMMFFLFYLWPFV
jgi:hypothetical protein